MLYCRNCHRLTPGDPLFCNHCGRSYDHKLCPRLHLNPRSAQICSSCRSADLSIPQPRVSWWRYLTLRLLSVLPGIVLFLLSLVLLLAFVQTLADPRILPRLIVPTVLVGLLWLIYFELPLFVRRSRQPGHRTSPRRGRHRRR